MLYEKIMHNLICVTSTIMFSISQVSELVENFNIQIYSNIMNMINVKLCMMVLHIERALSVYYTFCDCDIISVLQ